MEGKRGRGEEGIPLLFTVMICIRTCTVFYSSVITSMCSKGSRIINH